GPEEGRVVADAGERRDGHRAARTAGGPITVRLGARGGLMRTRRRHARDHRLEMGQPGNHWCEELVDRRGRRLEASPGRDWRTSKWTKTAKRSDAAISGPSATTT